MLFRARLGVGLIVDKLYDMHYISAYDQVSYEAN